MAAENEKLEYFDLLYRNDLTNSAIIEFHYLFDEKHYNRGHF